MDIRFHWLSSKFVPQLQNIRSQVSDRAIKRSGNSAVDFCDRETNDPWLDELVRRADAGESIIDTMDFSQTPNSTEDGPGEEKIEALTEMICRAGDEPGTKSAALLVLMATIENAPHPKALANTAKHLAFTRCGELNVNGMVNGQIVVFEGKLLAGDTLTL